MELINDHHVERARRQARRIHRRERLHRGEHMAPLAWTLAIHQQLTEGAIAQHLAEGGGLAPGRSAVDRISESSRAEGCSRLPVEMARGAWLWSRPTSWFTKASWCSGVAPPLRCSRAMRARPARCRANRRGASWGSRPMVSTRASWSWRSCCSRPSVRSCW